jgi:hypothetical protein
MGGAPSIDAVNDYFVSTNGQTFTVMRPPIDLTPDAALRLAAWLAVMAEPFASHTFDEVRDAVRST